VVKKHILRERELLNAVYSIFIVVWITTVLMPHLLQVISCLLLDGTHESLTSSCLRIL